MANARYWPDRLVLSAPALLRDLVKVIYPVPTKTVLTRT